MELPKLSNPLCSICRQPIEHPRDQAEVQTTGTKQQRRVHAACITNDALSTRRLERIPSFGPKVLNPDTKRRRIQNS